MRFEDTTPPRGEFVLSIRRNGVEVESYADRNMIMSSARDALARLLGGDGSGKMITHIGVGTDGNGPEPGDTALTSAYKKRLSGHSYPSTGRVAFSFTIGKAEANGKKIREFGLLCSDGTLFARKTRGVIEKADDIEIVGTWTIIF